MKSATITQPVDSAMNLPLPMIFLLIFIFYDQRVDTQPPQQHATGAYAPYTQPLSSARKRRRKLSANLNLFKKQEQKRDEEL